MRYLGFAPDDLTTAPWDAVVFVAQQLGVPPDTIHAYGGWRKTRTTHLQQVQAYLGFRSATPLDFYGLHTWLVERALEHDKPTLLLQLACDELHHEQIVRPGLTRLERLVATARQQAHDETFRRLTPLLADERPTFLDGLLLPDPQTGRTVLNWLRPEAMSHAASQMVETLKKVTLLLEAGVDTWELIGLTPNRVKWRAQLGWKAPTSQLQQMEPRRCYPILVAFLAQALVHHTDVAIEPFDHCLWEYYSTARQELAEFRQAIARSTNDKLMILRALGQVLLDPEIDEAAVRTVSFARVPEAVVRAAVVEPLKQEGYPVQESDLAHIWPPRYNHINVYGAPRSVSREKSTEAPGNGVCRGASGTGNWTRGRWLSEAPATRWWLGCPRPRARRPRAW